VRASAAERRELFGLFNVSEAARQLGVGIQILHRDIRAGRVQSPQVRLGRRLYFSQDGLRDLSTQYGKG
jgi:predicted site-specific integrase-resolvase